MQLKTVHVRQLAMITGGLYDDDDDDDIGAMPQLLTLYCYNAAF